MSCVLVETFRVPCEDRHGPPASGKDKKELIGTDKDIAKGPREDEAVPRVPSPDKEITLCPIEEGRDPEESATDGFVCLTLCAVCKDSGGPWEETECPRVPCVGVERSEVPSTDREVSKCLWEVRKGLTLAWADMESPRIPSSDTTCPGVAADILHAPGEDEYLGVSQGDVKGLTEPRAFREIFGDPWTNFIAPVIFWAWWVSL